jgi:hypothetical protein
MNASSKTFSCKNIDDMTFTLEMEKEYIKRFRKNELYGLIIYEYARRCYYYSRGYYKNNKNNVPIKKYLNKMLHCPITLVEAIRLRNVSYKQKIRIITFVFIDKIPYSIKRILLSI